MKLTPLHLDLNALLQGTGPIEFEAHVNVLSSVHLLDLYDTSHQVAAKEDNGLRDVRFRGRAFIPADVSQAVLEISPDGISAPISEVACLRYIILTRSASCALNCSSNCLQARFTALELGAYLEGTTWTW